MRFLVALIDSHLAPLSAEFTSLSHTSLIVHLALTLTSVALCRCHPLNAVRERILEEISEFDVQKCDQTMLADKLLVHRYIIEMHTDLLKNDDQRFEQLSEAEVKNGLDIFSSLVRTEVHAFVSKSLQKDHQAIMLFSFSFTFVMFWWTMLVLGAGFGTHYPLVEPDKAIEWAQDDSSRGTFGAVYLVCLVFGLIGLCCCLPAMVVAAFKRSGESSKNKGGKSHVVAPSPQIGMPPTAQPQVVAAPPPQAIAVQPVAQPIAQPIAQPMAQPIAQQTMVVACPAGVPPGGLVMVTTQGGVQLQVAVPPGIQPGQTFQVAFQAALPTMPMATPVAALN